MNKEKIHVFYTHNSQIKSNYAERVIRTLKNRLYSYFMENQTYKYVDDLKKLVESYNKTPHQSLAGATPASVTKTNEDEMRYIQYMERNKTTSTKSNEDEQRYIQYLKKKNEKSTQKPKIKKKKGQVFKFKLGDLVRISQLKRVFEKGYQENWTLEYFKVYKRIKRDNQDIYKLKDMLDNEIKGTFYRQELQNIDKSNTDMYKIEKIIKKRRYDRKEQVLVKWLGWPSKFNSWVFKNVVKDIK